MNSAPEIAKLGAEEIRAQVSDLARVLVDCVAGGASVSFMPPFERHDAETYFAGIADEVAAGDALLIAARSAGRIEGTVQLGLAMPPNQPHRADLRKLLVHRDARRMGLAAALLDAAEREARALGRWLLVLDTVKDGDGERVYRRQGWQRAGEIPDYALFPDGRFCDTVVFWKRLKP